MWVFDKFALVVLWGFIFLLHRHTATHHTRHTPRTPTAQKKTANPPWMTKKSSIFWCKKYHRVDSNPWPLFRRSFFLDDIFLGFRVLFPIPPFFFSFFLFYLSCIPPIRAKSKKWYLQSRAWIAGGETASQKKRERVEMKKIIFVDRRENLPQ